MRKLTAGAVMNTGVSIPSARHWHACDDGTVQCDVCPRRCHIADGQAGLCDVRASRGGELVLMSYGQGTGFHVDQIEHLRLYHYLPGSAVLSFGTAGCNLGCRTCSNPLVHPPGGARVLQQGAAPDFIAQAAAHLGARSVAFGNNDPIVFHEFAVDVAAACHRAGLRVVARTSGYVEPEPRRELFGLLDAVCVDLHGFREEFYERVCGVRLQPILETAAYVRLQTAAWLELSYRLQPGENDSAGELSELAAWIHGQLGPDVPLHFGVAPWMDGRASLRRARALAREAGLHHVYLHPAPDAAA
jgi:pyruvate formate lyase activating enzyme